MNEGIATKREIGANSLWVRARGVCSCPIPFDPMGHPEFKEHPI